MFVHLHIPQAFSFILPFLLSFLNTERNERKKIYQHGHELAAEFFINEVLYFLS
ncbi:hypothetical protein BPJM79_10602 [Bacillus pumilus]|uniref:Uncharacterized protein n=1 Tax=Bacillus pumilus TaxID=1408 RepID=A0AB34QXE5_BACPU|nr:hypothetical protein B4127_2965 [Bacillus pumilus]RAP14330.1 hypothetical protein C2W58_02430 [Bacillus pumilus]